LGELTKFRITPLHTILHCIKALMEDFNPTNIEVLSILLETCGRFLYRLPETHDHIQGVLDSLLKKKKTAINLDARMQLLIDNAYFCTNPPDKPVRKEKHRTPLEAFVRKLVFVDLTKTNAEKMLKLLRKLPWNDAAVKDMAVHLFSKPWKIKYNTIYLLAGIVSGLSRHQPDLGVRVVDTVLEHVRVGLEQNNYKMNQRRIATACYLGELYNYRMMDSVVIFDTLYTILSFGYEHGLPFKGKLTPLDNPGDFFRVSLVCTILNTCGAYFARGVAKLKLDAFLKFFQMYLLSKDPMPMEVEYMVTDMVQELRPKLRLFTTFEEAALAVEEMLRHNQEQARMQGPASDVELGSEEELVPRNDVVASESSAEESELSSTSQSEAEDEQDQAVVLLTKVANDDEEESKRFDIDFSRILAESIESRKHDKKAAPLDLAIPMNIRSTTVKIEPQDDSVEFILLTKRGGKHQVKKVGIPTTSSLVISTRQQQAIERKEQERLKQLVLDYEQREESQHRPYKHSRLGRRGH
jgi:regulator of nonsense transcripts 2